MDGSQAQNVAVAQAPRIPLATTSTSPRRLSVAVAALFGLGWPALIALLTVIEPAPADDMAPALWVELLGTAFVVAVLGTMIAAVGRLPVTARWSLAAGAGLLVLAISCPTTGHHAVTASWWLVELGAAVAMIATSAKVAARRH